MYSKIIFTILVPLVLLVSCNKEAGIEVLEVDTGAHHKEASQVEQKMPKLDERVNLIMGIVVPTSNRQWFIKIAGPYDEFEKVKPMFEQIRSTIKFDDYSVEVVTVDLAEGWVMQREKGFIHSSITHPDLITKITISSAKGTLLDNVNRWNSQLGMGPINEFGLTQIVTRANINGYFGLIVPIFKRTETQVPNQPAHPPINKDEPVSTDSKGIRIAFGVADNQTWYIKMTGDSNTLILQKKNFESFVQSFKFKDGKAEWDVPEGWEKTDGGSMAVGAYAIGQTRVTVIPLAAESGSVELNVNRWRRQLSLPAASLEDINKNMQKLNAGGNEFNYLLLTSTEGATQKTEPESEKVTGEGITYVTPASWEELKPSMMRKINLKASGMEVTGIFLGAAAKGVKKNVDRWCGQIGLEALTDEKMAEAVKEIPFNGGTEKASYAFLKGAEKSILAVIYDTADGVWFFKVLGETEKIMSEKENFESFIASIKVREAK